MTCSLCSMLHDRSRRVFRDDLEEPFAVVADPCTAHPMLVLREHEAGTPSFSSLAEMLGVFHAAGQRVGGHADALDLSGLVRNGHRVVRARAVGKPHVVRDGVCVPAFSGEDFA